MCLKMLFGTVRFYWYSKCHLVSAVFEEFFFTLLDLFSAGLLVQQVFSAVLDLFDTVWNCWFIGTGSVFCSFGQVQFWKCSLNLNWFWVCARAGVGERERERERGRRKWRGGKGLYWFLVVWFEGERGKGRGGFVHRFWVCLGYGFALGYIERKVEGKFPPQWRVYWASF